MTRRFLPLSLIQATVLFSLAALSVLSQAQTAVWPQKPIRIIVPFSAGGNTDTIARLTAERLTRSLGQPVLIENRAGAGGAIAADLVANATPDGYTLLMAAMPVLAILPTITKTNFDPLRDFTTISIVGSNPFVMAVHKSVPANNAKELADFVKKNPGKLNYASGGSGSVSHLSAALFVNRANIDMTHISYKGGNPAVADLLGGQVQMYFGNLSELAPHAAGGQIRIIGVSSDQRAHQLPDVPTVAESGFPGFKTITWNGLVAPAGTPPAVISRIALAVKDAVRVPDTIAKFSLMGVDPIGDTPAQFLETLKADLVVWSEAAKASNLKME
jgi:tripartite-type tricarboxylate transporter receptor subunit TctC